MAKYTKKVISELDKLKDLIRERRKEARLMELYNQFKSWKAGKLSTSDMEDLAGRFIPLDAMEQQKRIRGEADPAIPVAEALLEGVLKRSEVSDKTLKEIDILIKVMEV